ncbi:MAG TPA: hypothetical protein VMV53_00820 [Acidimicrobiales bacterium]|nr:hypothetical protein [Acidimicrobiales bacterium]
MHQPHHTLAPRGTLALASLVLAALVLPVTSAPARAAVRDGVGAHASVPMCTSSAISYTRSTNARRYPLGAVVIMTATLRNISRAACAVETGPLSPLFTIGDAGGHTLWNNCYTNDAPGPCPQYLVRRTLARGAAYSATARWDQRAGAPARQVVPGRYYLTTSVHGVRASGRLAFDIAASRTVSVSAADSGRTYRLSRGDRLVVHLRASSPYAWSEPVASSARVLARVRGSAGSITSTTFLASAPGRATVRASENAICYPQCLPPTRLFSITVRVVA